MIKSSISPLVLALFLMSGCGGGGAGDTGGSSSGLTQSDKKGAVPTDKGKTDGKYNLWDYMAPKNDRTNNFVETTGDSTKNYKTTYSTSPNRVTETSDYAKNEKTIYTKEADRVTVSFEKDGTPNGEYALDLTADIGDIVTVKESTCKLTKHYDTVDISGKNFTDVIEIKCGDIPGYYQKGVGEIAQVEEKNKKSIRVLSN